MIPRLHPPTPNWPNIPASEAGMWEQSVFGNVVTELPGCMTALVTERLNAEFVATVALPIESLNAGKIQIGSILALMAGEKNDNPQPFTVVKIDKTTDMLTLTCQHISYRADNAIVTPHNPKTPNELKNVFSGAQNQVFNIYGGASTPVADPGLVIETTTTGLQMLKDGASAVGGYELRYNVNNISLDAPQRGDSGIAAVIAYGYNLLSINLDEELPEIPQKIFPYCSLPDGNGNNVYIDRNSEFTAHATWSNRPFHNLPSDLAELSLTGLCKPVDVTDIVKKQMGDDVTSSTFLQTDANLKRAAETWVSENVKPIEAVSISADYLNEHMAPQVDGTYGKPLIGLGDTVRIVTDKTGKTYDCRCVEVRYDALKERNEGIVIGAPKRTIYSLLRSKIKFK